MAQAPATLLATSLKMYLDHDQTLEWTRRVRAIAADSAAANHGRAELVVFPSFPSLPETARILTDAPVAVGAQNMAAAAAGAYTGEVSAATLAQVGCTYVEIGHAERRRYFAETPAQVRQKVTLAVEYGLTPLLCVGEDQRSTAADAAATCIAQTQAAISALPRSQDFSLVLAYEPEWAIGATDSADPAYIREVAAHINHWLRQHELHRTRLIYGGSAKPGLLSDLGEEVCGLFLGRYAHDPQALSTILDETPHQDRRNAQTW